MPNTIAHFAVSGVLTRSLIKTADLKWIFLACVLPDIPWILQRIIRLLPYQVDELDMKAYSVVQASLIFCVLLSSVAALLATNKAKILFILGIGSVIHLALDATQIKWGNGVHFLAPVSWNMMNFGFFWPENIASHALTVSGVIYFLVNVKKATEPNSREFTIRPNTVLCSALLMLIWLVAPVYFISSVYDSNNHYLKTLKNVPQRVGKTIEFDRNTTIVSSKNERFIAVNDELIRLYNVNTPNGKIISVQGTFTNTHTIQVTNLHIHSKSRDYASIVGLSGVLLVWVTFFIRTRMARRIGTTSKG